MSGFVRLELQVCQTFSDYGCALGETFVVESKEDALRWLEGARAGLIGRGAPTEDSKEGGVTTIGESEGGETAFSYSDLRFCFFPAVPPAGFAISPSFAVSEGPARSHVYDPAMGTGAHLAPETVSTPRLRELLAQSHDNEDRAILLELIDRREYSEGKA